jgi:16S rRNA (cytidine1402-2'-O)-methyltransferase
MNMSGILYICPTPIGNLEDITIRTLNILKEVDFIAAEDTRNTVKILNHYDIKNKMISYHEHNKEKSGPEIIKKIKNGENVGIVTDAGMPGISDPGEELVKLAFEEDIKVVGLPGATASITALVTSGQNTRYFCFEGFLPRKNKEVKERIELLKNETRTIILYESPHRLKETLKLLNKELGNRSITISREITKKFEEIVKTTLDKALEIYIEKDPRGEYVLIIEGKDLKDIVKEEVEKWDEISGEEHYMKYINEGYNNKEAMKLVAKDRNVSKREIYAILNKDK